MTQVYFDHEKLTVYQRSVEFVKLANTCYAGKRTY